MWRDVVAEGAGEAVATVVAAAALVVVGVVVAPASQRRSACHARSLRSKASVCAGLLDGRTRVACPAAAHVVAPRAAVVPLNATAARSGAARRIVATSPCTGSRIAASRLPA